MNHVIKFSFFVPSRCILYQHNKKIQITQVQNENVMYVHTTLTYKKKQVIFCVIREICIIQHYSEKKTPTVNSNKIHELYSPNSTLIDYLLDHCSNFIQVGHSFLLCLSLPVPFTWIILVCRLMIGLQRKETMLHFQALTIMLRCCQLVLIHIFH